MLTISVVEADQNFTEAFNIDVFFFYLMFPEMDVSYFDFFCSLFVIFCVGCFLFDTEFVGYTTERENQ